MKGQYEQQCNAEAAKRLGATTLDNLNLLHHRSINLWLSQGEYVHVNFRDETEEMVQKVLTDFDRNYSKSAKNSLGEKTTLEKLSVLKYLF